MDRRVWGLVMLAVVASCHGNSYSSPTIGTPIPAGPTTVLVPAGTYAGSGPGFAPATLTVAVGTTVTWGNNDSTAHTATADGGQWNSSTIDSGKTFTFRLNTPGSYKYHCIIHSFMNGAIVVQ